MYVYGSGDKWASMTKVPGETNLWVGTVPSGSWTNVIFCRMNPGVTTNDWSSSFWGGQTQNLVYDGKNNWFTVDSKKDPWNKPAGTWSLYSTEPIITVVSEPEFPATTIEETATATLKYTVENSEDKATITIDNDAFTAVDNNGTVTITFAPTEAKEYTATITIAVGEVKETVEISAIGLAKDVVKDPEVLNLTAPEFTAIIEGNTTTAIATYELLNADEAEAKVEGEGFAITEQEVGKVTIQFAPTKAGEYTGTLLVLVAGQTLKEIQFTATAKPSPYYAIRGSMTDWSDKNDIKMTANEDKSEYAIQEFEIAAGDKFKVVYVNEDNVTSWYGTDKVTLEAGITNKGTGDGDIEITPAGKYDIYYKVKEGKIWIQKYVEPKEPKINIIVADFERNTAEVGDETDAAVVYSLENIESAEVEIEGEYVTFEQTEVEEGFMIAVFFRPEVEGEFPGKLTISAGEISEEIEFTFIATEAEKEPVINILQAEFSQNEVEVGDDTEAIVVYSLENAESAEVTIEGEYFTMEEYPEEVEGEGNYIEITFAPEKAGEYICKLTITAGEVSKVLEYPFYAVEPKPETEIIAIKVAAPENWESCYLWAWEIGGKDLFDTFPGVSMPKGEDGFYVMNLEISGPIGFLVSNGSGIQTESYNDVAEDMCFNVVSVEGNLILEVNEDCQYVAPEIPKVTFNVLVPGGTEVCYIAGTPLWSPIEMEKVEGEENMFTITTDLLNGKAWKYCAGPSFDYVELTAEGGNVMDRTEYGEPDVVEAWKAVYDPQPDDPTAVEEVEALGIYATNGTIYADEAIAIYTLAGVDVTAQNGSLYGIYVVKSDKGNALISVW
jgi:sorbitol-specific phosphotransferase system component IIA